MSALIDNATAMYVQDDTPTGELSYSARFVFDPNGITMARNDTHRIMVARNNQVDVIRIDLRRSQAGAYQLSASVRKDAGSYLTTSWFTISDAPHTIEIAWRAASGAGLKDGSLILRVNGAPKQILGGLDNDTLRVEQARLGPLQGLDGRTFGTEFFDEFIATRVAPSAP